MPDGQPVRSLQSLLARHCFTEFALEQPVSLEVLSRAAQEFELPMAAALAPEWFSAAAQPEADLLVQAPELQILPGEPMEVEQTSARVADIDLVSMYAPELAAARDAARAQVTAAEKDDVEVSKPAPKPDPTPVKHSPDSPDTMRLLGELSGLDD